MIQVTRVRLTKVM